jgi:hypothetical protein
MSAGNTSSSNECPGYFWQLIDGSEQQRILAWDCAKSSPLHTGHTPPEWSIESFLDAGRTDL